MKFQDVDGGNYGANQKLMRRRRKKRSGALWFFIMILLIALIGFYVISNFLSSNMSTPVDAKDTTMISFEIDKGESATAIATKLEARGLIKSGFAFTWAVSSRELDDSFHHGSYQLSRSMPADDILRILTSSAADVRITIPEGFTTDDIAKKLSDQGVADPISFRECINLCEYPLPVLEDRPEGQSLEGYLFPDTYDFTTGTEAREIIEVFVRNFNKKFDLQMREDAQNEGHSLHEIVTVASMIEKEVSDPTDRRIVSGIIWTRLESGIPLGIDATVLYAIGTTKTDITAEDLRVDSPYNTRVNKGLPPGPISNPGLDSLQAALYPQDSDWLFYLTDTDGVTHYAKTNAEHEENKRLYL